MTSKETLYKRLTDLKDEIQQMWYTSTISNTVRTRLQSEIHQIQLALVDLEHEYNMNLIQQDAKEGSPWT